MIGLTCRYESFYTYNRSVYFPTHIAEAAAKTVNKMKPTQSQLFLLPLSRACVHDQLEIFSRRRDRCMRCIRIFYFFKKTVWNSFTSFSFIGVGP